MIDIKTIAGEQLVSVPILQDAVIHEELMASDYIVLAWSSENGRELPVGAYIEYEGERYSLYEPYTPTMVSEGEYRYSPQFHSREEAWNKQPACVYTYEEDGTTVKSREFDWTFVGSPADAMQIVKQAIKNEIGEDWSIVIADSLPATIEISSQTSSITSILSDIATQCETEYWVDKKENIIHLSKCEHGDTIALEVGNNVGVPSVMSKGSEYFTRYYALGSTRNITQTTGNINGAVNKRLTLDPNVFPMGYKEIRGHYENDVFVSDLENGEIFSKVVLFDDIYPSSDLEIISVRARMKYRLDGGKKVRVGGTDENPVYDQYAIWYFKIKDFTFSEDSLIEGIPLSVHFKSGRLAGQEFELIYHAKAKRENTDGDVLPFDIEAGDFEIKFKESSGAIIPDIAYIVPQNTDKVTLFNVEMPSEYTAAAQQRLLEALDKVIAREHEDSNTYEVESNPIAFYEANMVISLGQRVSFVNGDKSLETRVLMVERRLDSPSEQKIRVGNDLIQGSTKELRANVESLNHNVDVLSAFNDLSKNIQDSYGRTQALINEAVASVLGIWSLDENGNLVTEKQVIVKNNIIISGDTSTGGTGQDTPSGIDEAQLKEYLDKNKYITSDYAYSKEEVNRLIDEVNAGDVDLTNYYTKEEVNSKIDNLNLSQYAKASDLSALQGEVDNIEAILGMDEEAEGIINTWNEVKAFLDGYSSSDDLAAILSTMNADIAKRALDSDLDTLAGRVGVLESNKADKATTLAGYGITDAYTKVNVDDLLKKYLLLEAESQTIKGNLKIEGNLIIAGDMSSEGTGGNSGADGTVIGVVVNGTRYENETNGMLDLSTLMNQYALATAIPTTLPASDVYEWAKKSSLALVDIPDLSSRYLSTAGGTISSPNYAPLTIMRVGNASAAISFENSVDGVVGQLGIGGSGYSLGKVPFFSAGGNTYALIHSGNIGSYNAGSAWGLRINEIANVNDSITQSFFMTGFQAANRPDTSQNYSTGITLHNNALGYTYQLAYSTSNALYSRRKGANGWESWKQIAFTDSNVASATKLQTARTIWGQSFDGTGNVKGGLIAVQNIDFESNNLHDVGNNSRQARYIYAGWFGSKTGESLSFGANNGTHMLITPSGNVLIGTTTDSGYKLDVNGTINATTGYISKYANDAYPRFRIVQEGGVTYMQASNSGSSVSGSWYISGSDTNAAALCHIKANNIALTGAVTMSSTLSVGSTIHSKHHQFVTENYSTNTGNGRIGCFDFPYSVTVQIGGNGKTENDREFCFRILNNVWNKDLFHVGNSGKVGIGGIENPQAELHVKGNAIIEGDMSSTSDMRLKQRIDDVVFDLKTIAEMPIFTFRWKDGSDSRLHLGSSAQYWEKPAPWLVMGDETKTLNYAVLGVAGVKALAVTAVDHETRIKMLERKVNELETENRRLRYGN